MPTATPMKRARAKLSFDDEEGSGSSGDERPPIAKIAPRGLPGAGQGTSKNDDRGVSSSMILREALQARTQRPAPTSPEEKYAWMDSDDDDAKKAPSEASEAASDADLKEVALPSTMKEIRTFSEFVRLTAGIKKAVADFPADELVALCETAARLKYFDGDLFEAVFRHIILRMRASEFDATQTTLIAVYLADLNAYNARLFSVAASILLPNVGKMPKAQRLQWIDLLVSVGHRGDDAFVEALRLAPLLPGETAADDLNMCWQFMNGGFCPRGTKCKWTHPAKKSSSMQPRKTK